MKKPKKFIKLIPFLVILMLSFNLMAEYRAYQYIVKSKNSTELPNKNVPSSIIVSTLNPISFIAYNGGEKTIAIELINSWICPGNTSNKPICAPYLTQGNNGN